MKPKVVLDEEMNGCPRCGSEKRKHIDTTDYIFSNEALAEADTQSKEYVCLECRLSYSEWTILVDAWKHPD